MTTRFDELGLDAKLLLALTESGYTNPTEIQERTIPSALEGRDLIALAQTGTGKTAAFALPTLQHLMKSPVRKGMKAIRALVITPTRELALQVSKSFDTYGAHTKITTQVVYGGVSIGAQVRALRDTPDVLVATPGRLIDLITQGRVFLDRVEVLVLDEADRMLDMGFIHDIRRIIKLVPNSRQTLFFSATMLESVSGLAESMLKDPIRVETTPTTTISERIEQRLRVINHADRFDALVTALEEFGTGRTIVFSRTKHRADRTARQLARAGIRAQAIHSDRTQVQRQRALDEFTRGKCEVLVATDIVARGIDVDDVTLIINAELPDDPESYIHRIGRTARAGASGLAVSLCDSEEILKLRQIEKIVGDAIPLDTDHVHHNTFTEEALERMRSGGKSGGRGGKKPGGRGPRQQSNGQASGNGQSTPNKSRRGPRRKGTPAAGSAPTSGGGDASAQRGRRQGGSSSRRARVAGPSNDTRRPGPSN